VRIRSQFHQIINRKFREVTDSDGLRLGKGAVLRRTLEILTTIHTAHKETTGSDRQIETERHIRTQRQANTQTQKGTDTERDRQTHRQAERQTHIHKQVQIEKETD